MSDTIFSEILKDPGSLTVNDLHAWVVPGVLCHFIPRLDGLIRHAYGLSAGQEVPEVLLGAFKERCKETLFAASQTFLLKLKHWEKNSVPLEKYLFRSLKNLSEKIWWDLQSGKKVTLPVCPACKVDNVRTFLSFEEKLWRCTVCTNLISAIKEEVKKDSTKSNLKLMSGLQAKLKLRQAFSLHSRKGYRCPDCDKFIPHSLNGKFGISCPYEDCIYFGSVENLEVMIHPTAQGIRNDVSLNKTLSKKDGGKDVSLQDLFSSETVNADIQIEVNQKNRREFETLNKVIEDQINQIKRTNASSTIIQKLLMYEAFKNMIAKFPEEMVSYLVHKRVTGEFPIQARIFQEYVLLIENFLPFDIFKKNQKIEIMDLTDPNLNLFDGISSFEAPVGDDGEIPNLTKETYTGGRKGKFYGRYFIGRLINVVDVATGESLLDKVVEYSFASIKMADVPVGTNVKVNHFRITPHYEMGGMVFLQRIRESIVESVETRLRKNYSPSGRNHLSSETSYSN